MDRGSGVFIKYGVAARGFYMSMRVALPLSAGRNLSWDLFFIKDFKAARCLGVRLSGVLSSLGL